MGALGLGEDPGPGQRPQRGKLRVEQIASRRRGSGSIAYDTRPERSNRSSDSDRQEARKLDPVAVESAGDEGEDAPRLPGRSRQVVNDQQHRMPTRFPDQEREGSRGHQHAGRRWTLPYAAGDGDGISLRRGSSALSVSGIEGLMSAE